MMMTATSSKRPGFTLVELLTVMVVLSIMGSMVLVATGAASRAAKESRTRAIVTAVDTVIQELYDSYKHRPIPLSLPSLDQNLVGTVTVGSDTRTVGRELSATEAARTRLRILRDLQRMELPDTLTDIHTDRNTGAAFVNGPMTFRAAANLYARNETTGRERFFSSDDYPRVEYQVDSSILSSRRQRAYSSALASIFVPDQNETANESAECLYLILANTQYAGRPAIDSLPRNSIGDTDGDGLQEILDGWGTPLRFVRWPVGYVDPSGTMDASAPDDFDLLRVDFGHLVDGVTPSYSLRPLVISAGADKEFGIAATQGPTPGGDADDVDYTSHAWPLDAMDTETRTPVGDESEGRTTPFAYPDPYLREQCGNRPSVLPGTIFNSDAAADDVTNFTIKVSQ